MADDFGDDAGRQIFDWALRLGMEGYCRVGGSEAFVGTESDGSGQYGRIPMSPISLVTRHLVARGPADSHSTWAILRAS